MWQKFYPAQRKPCLCQRVSVCPWRGILTACLMPWTSRGISIGIASGVCVVFAIYGWSIYRPWFGALATKLRKNCAELPETAELWTVCLWGNFVSEEKKRQEGQLMSSSDWIYSRCSRLKRNVLIHLDPSTWLGVSMRICSFDRFIMLGWVLYILLCCLYPQYRHPTRCNLQQLEA